MSECDRPECFNKSYQTINIRGNFFYLCKDHFFNYLEPIIKGREDEAIKSISNYKYQSDDELTDLVRANPLCVGMVLERMKKAKGN